MPPTVVAEQAVPGAGSPGVTSSSVGVTVPLTGSAPAAGAASSRATGSRTGSRAPWATLLAEHGPRTPSDKPPVPSTAVPAKAVPVTALPVQAVPAKALPVPDPTVLAPGRAKRPSDGAGHSTAPHGAGERPSLVVALTDPTSALVRLDPTSVLGGTSRPGHGGDRSANAKARGTGVSDQPTTPTSSKAHGAQPSPSPGTSTAGATSTAGPTAQPKGQAHATPGAKPRMRTANWTMPGFVLPAKQLPVSAATNAAPAFRHALAVSLAARPSSPRPDAASLLRWATTLEKAAQVAPDRPTAQHLRTVSRYVAGLARVPLAGRAKAQVSNYYVMATARDLRGSLPARFGIALLG